MPEMKAAVAAVAVGTGAGADTVAGLKYGRRLGPGMAEAYGWGAENKGPADLTEAGVKAMQVFLPLGTTLPPETRTTSLFGVAVLFFETRWCSYSFFFW